MSLTYLALNRRPPWFPVADLDGDIAGRNGMGRVGLLYDWFVYEADRHHEFEGSQSHVLRLLLCCSGVTLLI